MKRNIILLLTMILGLALLPAPASAQEMGTVSFTSDNTILEDNPKTGEYNITIFSPDGEWKIQLNYHADSMFGTFGNADFRLDGDGRYFNFARNPKNEMVFYSFTNMEATVTDEGELYRVKADCTSGTKIRFVVEATIAAPKPKEVRSDDLGYARIVPNTFMGINSIYAENDNYKLAYGIADSELEGTFYRANILMPELTDKQTGKAITATTATAVHTRDGENLNMVIDIVSDELIQYHLTMVYGPHDIEVTGEKDIVLKNGIVQDLSDMYGCFQFGAQDDNYAVAIAVNPEAMTSGRTEWKMEDLFMTYTVIMDMKSGEMKEIYDMNVKVENNEGVVTLKAEALCMDGTLYHITMTINLSGGMPEVTDTINIDFGHARMLDYTQGLGVIGVGAYIPEKYQIRFYLNTHWLLGEFDNDSFIMDGCDVMVVEGEKYVFHDAKYMHAIMEQDDDNRTLITVDMVGVDDVLYHATMYIDDLDCMYDGDYTIDYKDGVQMVALMEGTDGEIADFILQFQSQDNYVFSFPISHEDNGSIAGTYEFAVGNLYPDQQTFYENGCEVRVASIAGTLNIEPVQKVTLDFGASQYNTYMYKASFQIVGLNNVIYRGTGNNFLLCIDVDENWMEMDEDEADSIREQLAEQGLKVRKVLRDGKLLIEADGKAFDMNGRQVRR